MAPCCCACDGEKRMSVPKAVRGKFAGHIKSLYPPSHDPTQRVSPRGSDRSMVGLNRPFADQFRTTSFMHCSSSTAGTSVRLTRSWAGCPDRVVVSGLSPDGEVFLLTSPFIDRYPVQDIHEPRLKVKDENVGWKHTCSACSHAGFERIGSRSGYNPVQDIYILQRPSSCDPHFRYSEFLFVRRAAIYGFAVLRQLESGNTTLRVRSVISVELCRSDTGWESSSGVRCFGGSICRHVSISNPSSGGHDRSNPDDIVAAGRGHSHRRHYVGGQTSPVNVTSIMFPVKLTLR